VALAFFKWCIFALVLVWWHSSFIPVICIDATFLTPQKIQRSNTNRNQYRRELSNLDYSVLIRREWEHRQLVFLSNMWRDKWLFLVLVSAWSVIHIRIFWLLYANCNKGQGYMTLHGQMFDPGGIWDIWLHIFMFTLRTMTWWTCSRCCAAKTNNKCSMHDAWHISASLSERIY
jgi:hypothetical protein